VLKKYLKSALADRFGYVLIDLPSNADGRHKLVINALVMSDFVVIPTDPNQISLNQLPSTYKLIDHAHDVGGDGWPVVLGMVLNKTDRRGKSYQEKIPPLRLAGQKGEIPPLFESFLPDSPSLARATDETADPRTLREKFDAAHEKMRDVAKELDHRCEN